MTRPDRDTRAPAPDLTGTGLVADDLYLMAHHEVTGKPLLQPRAAGLGLAGALLAELALAGVIGMWQGQVVLADAARPADGLARDVLDVLVREAEPHPVRDWLAFLGRTAAGDVARRLERSGYLTCARRAWRGQRWVPVNADCAFAPIARVKSALNPARPVTAQGAVLAGLAVACGLGSRLALYLPPDALRRVDVTAGQLDPGLHGLIAQTQAAVDSALLAHRA
jgi:hypothetical protein